MKVNKASAQGNGEPLWVLAEGETGHGRTYCSPQTESLPVPGFLSHHIWGRLASVEAPRSSGSTLPGGVGSPPCRAGRQRGKYVPADLESWCSALQGDRSCECQGQVMPGSLPDQGVVMS